MNIVIIPAIIIICIIIFVILTDLWSQIVSSM